LIAAPDSGAFLLNAVIKAALLKKAQAKLMVSDTKLQEKIAAKSYCRKKLFFANKF